MASIVAFACLNRRGPHPEARPERHGLSNCRCFTALFGWVARAVRALAKSPRPHRAADVAGAEYRVAMPELPHQVVDLDDYRRRAKRAPPQRPSQAGPDQHHAEQLVDSLLEAMPGVALIPPPMLLQARAFCVGQLANVYSQIRDDHPMLVQLAKEVRAALRRSLPDPFLLQALADAGSVWATPGASHWPVAWLHEIAPCCSRVLRGSPG